MSAEKIEQTLSNLNSAIVEGSFSRHIAHITARQKRIMKAIHVMTTNVFSFRDVEYSNVLQLRT